MSDFVEEENGQLIVHNEEGDVVKDVQHIIIPGWVAMHGGTMTNSSRRLTK